MNFYFLFFFLMIIIIFILCELDRTYEITYTKYSYYIECFPNQIYYGVHNSIYRIFNRRYRFDTNKFNFHHFLMKNVKNLQNEFITHNKNIQIHAHKTTKILDYDESYSYIRFLFFNKLHTQNIKKFKTIEKFLKLFPEIKCCFLSIMKKKKYIKTHRGPYSGLLRYHLPVFISNPYLCYIEVMGKKLYYDKSFIFDDTYPHLLMKKDDSLRVVLICDVINPYSFSFF